MDVRSILCLLSLAVPLLSKILGVPCENEDVCKDFSQNATCVDGVCWCPDGKCKEVSYTMVLVNAVGGKCEKNENCIIPNAICDSNYQCSCKESFIPAANKRKCLKDITRLGEECGEDAQCSVKSAVCLERKCACDVTSYEANGKCHRAKGLNEPCSTQDECSLAKFSSCINSTCKCDEKYVPSASGCLPIAEQFDSPCVENLQCTAAFGRNSQCLGGRCQCQDLFNFNPKFNSCVRDILLDEICGQHSDCHQPGSGTSRLECIDGNCKCKPFYREESGYCISSASHDKLLGFQQIVAVNLVIFTIYFIIN